MISASVLVSYVLQRKMVRKHKVAFILAVLASLIVAFPQIYLRFEPFNQGIELIPDSPWAPRVREIQDGHGFGSIYYEDGKEDPYLHLPLGTMVVAYMGEVFGLDINNTLLLSRLVLPLAVFLLIYAFVFLLSADKLAALSVAALIVFADSVLNYYDLFRFLKGLPQGLSPSNFLELSRPVYSAMTLITFFGFLISFLRFFQTKNWRWGVVATFILGLEFYNYFYTWTYLYAFGAILGLVFLVRKEWPEVKLVAGVYIGALLVAIPYFVNLYKASLYPTYAATALRHGLVGTHAPVFIGLVALAALIVFLFGFPREDKRKYFFGLALLLAPIITLNQQIITGKALQTGHYHWYFHRPIAVVFVLVIAFAWLRTAVRPPLGGRTAKWLAVLLIIGSFATGAFIQAASYLGTYEGRDGGHKMVERQRYGPAMDWLNENAEKEEVVFANEEVSNLVAIYTPLNVFHHRSDQLFLSATDERLLDIVFTFYRLRGVGMHNVEEVFHNERGSISTNLYGIYYRELLGAYENIPEEKLEEIITLYKETLKSPTQEWLSSVWHKYDVEYLIWDKVANPSWKLDLLGFLKKEADFGQIMLYRIEI